MSIIHMTNLLNAFKKYIQQEKLYQPNTQWLLAISGGVDSIVLLHLCLQVNIPVILAHANFQLRGEESNRDEDFVNQLATQHQLPIHVKRFDTKAYTIEHKLSTQVAARELRYSWFNDLTLDLSNGEGKKAKQLYIATAHHADDNVETVLINFFKGTGISGLHGILPKQKNIIRPLLFATKKEILDYAKKENLKWVEDSSNATDTYTRNAVRHQLIPVIENIFPTAQQNLQQNILKFRDAEILYQQALQQWIKKLCTHKNQECHIPVNRLVQLPAAQTILFEIIRTYHFTSAQVQDAWALTTADSGKWIQSPTHRIIRNRAWLIITPLQSTQTQHIVIDHFDDVVHYPEGIVQAKNVSAEKCNIEANTQIAYLDAKHIHFPLLLRPWAQGDYFYPLGLGKKKKLSRFFIDQKLSLPEKEKVWVLEMDKKIIWIIGYRIDDRFKVTPQTKTVLKIERRPQ